MSNKSITYVPGPADSDSVNLGSNPGPPAKQKAPKNKDFEPARPGRPRRKKRNDTGTSAAQARTQSLADIPGLIGISAIGLFRAFGWPAPPRHKPGHSGEGDDEPESGPW